MSLHGFGCGVSSGSENPGRSDEEHNPEMILTAQVILSAYPHPLYTKALTGWVQYTIPARTGNGTPRHETIWTNHTLSTFI